METLSPKDIRDILQEALFAEVSALAMYARHGKHIEEAGLASAVQTIGEVEAEHARKLAERIRALGGDPDYRSKEATVIGRSLTGAQTDALEMLRLELEEENRAIVQYAQAIARIVDDEVTLGLLEENLLDELRHARWLREQVRRLSRSEDRG